MFERFTDSARRVVVLAQEEARQLNHNYIGSEHLLLGLLREEGDTAQTLDLLGVTYDGMRSKIEWLLGAGKTAPEGHIPFTPRAKKAMDQSLREALQLGHSYIGTEHLLLGIVHNTEGTATRLLLGYKVTPKLIRETLFKTAPTDSVTSDSDRLDTIIGLLEDITKKLDRLSPVTTLNPQG